MRKFDNPPEQLSLNFEDSIGGLVDFEAWASRSEPASNVVQVEFGLRQVQVPSPKEHRAASILEEVLTSARKLGW